MISPDPRFEKKTEGRALEFSLAMNETAPPVTGFRRRAKRQSVGRDERDQANPSDARATAKRSTDGRRLPDIRFKGRPSRDDDLSAVRPLRGDGRFRKKENARTDVRPGMPGAPFAFKDSMIH